MQAERDVIREEGEGCRDGVYLGTCVTLAIACRGEESADVGITSTLIESKDRGVLAEEAVVGVEKGTVDGGSGGRVAPRVAEAGELALEMVLKLDSGVLLNVRGDESGAMGKAELKGEVERCDTALGEEWMEGGVDRGLSGGSTGVGRLYMRVTLANNIRPVVGVDHGEVGVGGQGIFLSSTGGCELV